MTKATGHAAAFSSGVDPPSPLHEYEITTNSTSVDQVFERLAWNHHPTAQPKLR